MATLRRSISSSFSHIRAERSDWRRPIPMTLSLVSPNFLKDPRDLDAMITGLRYFRQTLETRTIADRIERIIAPDPDDFSDETLAAHCKKMVKTNFHPVGTAKTGADGDPMAVLDAKMRVRGIAGLGVCDMSAVPQIPAGNTNAPAMMLGDHYADLILGQL